MPKAFMVSAKKRQEQKREAEAGVRSERKKIEALLATVKARPKPKLKRLRSSQLGEKFVPAPLNSLTSGADLSSATAKKTEMTYTGTEIIGLGQLHKSNLVPIRGKKQAEEVAKMRRG